MQIPAYRKQAAYDYLKNEGIIGDIHRRTVVLQAIVDHMEYKGKFEALTIGRQQFDSLVVAIKVVTLLETAEKPRVRVKVEGVRL